MGNSFSPPCTTPAGASKVDAVKLVFWGGATRLLHDPAPLAGEVMIEHRDHLVCRADCFYVGRPIPLLEAEEELAPGETYFVLPAARLPRHALTVTSLSALSGGPKGSTMDFGECPFQYAKSADGSTLMKVSPEFITRIISKGRINGDGGLGGRNSGDGKSTASVAGKSCAALCNTPELQKIYGQLVVPRAQHWSPKLETICERKVRAPRRRAASSTISY